MNEDSPSKPEDEYQRVVAVPGEAPKMSAPEPTSSNTSLQTRDLSPSTSSETGSPLSLTQGGQVKTPGSSSTSIDTESAWPSPRVDKERTLRWMLSYRTIGKPDQDARLEEKLRELLDAHFGVYEDSESSPYELTQLRTKE